MSRARVDLMRALEALGATPWTGLAYRSTSPQRDPMSGRGAFLQGGRWNPRRGFPCVYLAEPRDACMAELYRRGDGRESGLKSLLPRDLYTIEARDLRVVDLTTAPAREAVGLTLADIRSDRRDACQEVAAAAHFLGFQGIRAPSATGVGFVVAAFNRHLLPINLTVVGQERIDFSAI